MQIKRDRWPSTTLFVFAAVGSAVGLGNIWRFPYLVGKYGGGAFLLPYIIALFLIGFPLLVMEFALGQKMQRGAVDSLGKIDHRLSGVGFGSILCSFGVSCYYAVIMSWCLLYVYYSLTLAWGDDTQEFFLHDVLFRSASASGIEGFAPAVLFALILSWTCVFFSIWKGVKSVGAVVLVTMPLPVLLLGILLARTVFLPGAMDGVRFYLTPQLFSLLDFEVWMAAISQVFFTLTLGFGVMITYASYQPRNSDIVKSALITCLADAAIALTAGLVVFTTLGHISHTSKTPIASLASTGPSLAFVAFPKALSLIPGAAVFSAIFFIMLVLLAIDSLFSLVEAVAAVFEDMFPKAAKSKIVFFVCLAGFSGGLVFTSTAGIYYLDIADYFLSNFGLVFMGLLLSLSVGWCYRAEKLRTFINEVSDIRVGKLWNAAIKYVIPLSLLLFLGSTFHQNIFKPYGNYPHWALWAFGWGLISCIIGISAAYSYFFKRKNG